MDQLRDNNPEQKNGSEVNQDPDGMTTFEGLQEQLELDLE